MYGAILGDIVGSPFEFDRGDKTKTFKLFSRGAAFTDDSVMTIAVAEALMSVPMNADKKTIEAALVERMQAWGKRYPHAGYGGRFSQWLRALAPHPYNSFGNGSAMRVSAVGWLYPTLACTRVMARYSAEVTHNHPEGIKGAEATACTMFLARNGASKAAIKKYVEDNFHYDLDRTLAEIRPDYHMDESCQGTVPEAIIAFLEAEDYEDAIRNAVSLGGDTDTLAAITGGIAEAFYGMPDLLLAECRKRIDPEMQAVLDTFDRFLGRVEEVAVVGPHKLRTAAAVKQLIEIIQADITTLQVDVIVNAANRSLLGGGGVDGAIHRAAGPELLRACQKLNGANTGEVKATNGFALPAKRIYHTPGPRWQGGHRREAGNLALCWCNALELAKQEEMHSIAFPSISTGAYGYPLQAAAHVAMQEVVRFLQHNSDYELQVIVTAFDKQTKQAYEQALVDVLENL